MTTRFFQIYVVSETNRLQLGVSVIHWRGGRECFCHGSPVARFLASSSPFNISCRAESLPRDEKWNLEPDTNTEDSRAALCVFVFTCAHRCVCVWLILWCVFSHPWPDRRRVCLALFLAVPVAGRLFDTLLQYLWAALISQQSRDARRRTVSLFPHLCRLLQVALVLPEGSFLFTVSTFRWRGGGYNTVSEKLHLREKLSLKELGRVSSAFFMSSFTEKLYEIKFIIS